MRKAITECLQSVLISGETVESTAIQRRVFALFHRRRLVAATNNRFIGLKRWVLGGFELQGIRWQDLTEVEISVGMIGANLSVTALREPDLATEQSRRVFYKYTGLRKSEAEAVYRICQAQEQAWRERRRLREIEELRAKSGGVQLAVGNAAGNGEQDPTDRLAHAKKMLDQNLISDSEYFTIKAQILSRV